LHFLPTLFVLTLLFPAYKLKIPLPATIMLLCATSASRAVIESQIIGDVYSPSPEALIVLSGARILEYAPLGILSFTLVEGMRGDMYIAEKSMIHVIIILALLILSAWLEPIQLDRVSANHGRLTWLVIEAALGTLMMCLAAQSVLLGSGRSTGDRNIGKFGHVISERALAIFLIHPFFGDFFDNVIGAPNAHNLAMVVPKLVFIIVCSILSSSLLIRVRYLRAIV
jgi:hypothetical protein